MDQKLYDQVEPKAEFLIQALPYIRDFSDKIVVIEYGCRKYLSPIDEQTLMKDIALLKTVGMRPVVVHDTPMGADKFRENKRIAKLIELCGVKAIGICGMDLDTLHMALDNDFIPVICPIGSDDEFHSYNINADDAACAIATAVKAAKLAFLTDIEGVYRDPLDRTSLISELTIPEAKEFLKSGNVGGGMLPKLQNCIQAIESGVSRVHILDGRIEHCLLLEFFTNKGIGTAIIGDGEEPFFNEQ